MACYDEALRFAKNRVQFERPIAGFQLVQLNPRWMITEITKGRLLVYRLGQLKEQGKAKHAHVFMAQVRSFPH